MSLVSIDECVIFGDAKARLRPSSHVGFGVAVCKEPLWARPAQNAADDVADTLRRRARDQLIMDRQHSQ